MMEGAFPKAQARIVKDFILCYQKELMEMWDTKKTSMLERKS